MQYLHQGLISRDLLDEIDDYSSELRKIDLKKIIKNALIEESKWQSDLLENITKISKKKRRRFLKKNQSESLDNIISAWNWTVKESKKTDSKNLNPYIVQKVASLIDPSNIDLAYGYRKGNVRLKDIVGFIPPRHEKVPFEMNDIFDFVNNEVLHPVERAIYFHLHCARTQPMMDCNKRTSRLLQDFVLVSEDYLPATVRIEEVEIYTSLLINAFKGYSNRVAKGHDYISEDEKSFYQYMGSKLIVEYDNALTLADQINKYEINFSSPLHLNDLFQIKNSFEGYFRSRNIPCLVKIDKKNRTFLKLDGDICESEIECLLDDKLKYNIRPLV